MREKIVKLLINRNETISTMESCTGGGVANAITNIEGASSILKFSAVTYSNEFKIKMGVNKDIIDKYSVYSMNVAREMAKNISDFTNSTYGVGITGKLNKADINNNFGNDNEVFVSIYTNNKFYDFSLNIDKLSRLENKEVIIDKIFEKLEDVINEKDQ